jgi:hypothetical protein
MAPFLAAGGPDALFLVVPLFGALLVASTYVAGARFGSHIGFASALITACSPAFLYQLMMPMSDVPAAALWMAAVAAVTAGPAGPLRGTRHTYAAVAGLATGGAILMRPNLLPLGIPIGLFLLLRPERSRHERLRDAITYAAWSAPGCLAVALIQDAFYGSPLRSGYGSLAALFAADHIAPNAARYASWLSQTHTPAWMLAAAAPILVPGALARLFLGMFLVNVASYLPYVVFNDWWYLRFLLPTIPLVLILMVAGVDAMCRRIKPSSARPAVGVAAALLAWLLVGEARARSVFDLRRLEARFERAGLFVDRRLPRNAFVITSWQSGSVRFYSGRLTLVWDALDPAWLDRAVEYSRTRGFEPFLLFEGLEEQSFRRRFAASAIGALDWPPMAEVASQVRIYRPGDRARYLSGTQPPTEYAR